MATSIRTIHPYQANAVKVDATASPEDTPHLRRRINSPYIRQIERIRLIARLNILEAISLDRKRREQSIRGWLKVRRSQADRGLSSNEPVNVLKIDNFDWPIFSIIRPPTFLTL